MPSRKDTLRAAAACALLAWAGWLHAAEGVTAQQVLVGQSITLQGGKNAYGAAVMDGVRTYLDKINAQGGVHGRQVALRTLDDDSQAAKAEANARQLVEKDQVFVLFGSVEGCPSTAVMRVAVSHKVPFIGPMAGSPSLRVPHQPMVFPVRAEHKEEFRVLLEYAKMTGIQRVGFMRADSDTGQQHLKNVQALCQQLGLQLTADLPFKSDESDAQIAALAQRLGSSNTQLVFNHGGIGVYEKLIRQARQQGVKVQFSAVNSGATQLAANLGPLAQGMVVAQVVPSPWERKTAIAREYQDDFKQRHPGKAFSYGSLEGYITAKALVAALRLAGPQPTRESLVTGIEKAGQLELSGLRNSYRPGQHLGMQWVDLSLVNPQGRFVH